MQGMAWSFLQIHTEQHTSYEITVYLEITHLSQIRKHSVQAQIPGQ